MSEELRLFILEDTKSQITLYSDAVDDFKIWNEFISNS